MSFYYCFPYRESLPPSATEVSISMFSEIGSFLKSLSALTVQLGPFFSCYMDTHGLCIFLFLQLICSSQWQGDSQRLTSLTVSLGLPVSRLHPPHLPLSWLLPFSVGLLVSFSAHLCPPQSIPSHSIFSPVRLPRISSHGLLCQIPRFLSFNKSCSLCSLLGKSLSLRFHL